MDNKNPDSDFLIHHGIKGQKWGVRRSPEQLGYNKRNPNYTEKQRQRDRQFYGKGGERRINRKLNEGQGIQSARNYESDRLHRARNVATTNGYMGRITGAAMGGVIGVGLPSFYKSGAKYVANKTKNPALKTALIASTKMSPETEAIVTIGTTALGGTLGAGAGSKLGTNLTMRAYGYSSKKARNSTAATGTVGTRNLAKKSVSARNMAALYQQQQFQTQAAMNTANAGNQAAQIHQQMFFHSSTDSFYQLSDVLIHHGIKGMKWGVRRTPEQLGHEKSKTSEISKGKRNTKRDEESTIRERIRANGGISASPKNPKLYQAAFGPAISNELEVQTLINVYKQLGYDFPTRPVDFGIYRSSIKDDKTNKAFTNYLNDLNKSMKRESRDVIANVDKVDDKILSKSDREIKKEIKVVTKMNDEQWDKFYKQGMSGDKKFTNDLHEIEQLEKLENENIRHSEEVANVLIHHGIKGMKWGVRRTPEQLGYYEKHKVSNKRLDKKSAKDVKTNKKMQKQANRNKRVMAGEIAYTKGQINEHRRAADAYRKSAEDIRKHGYDELRKAGFNDSTSKEATRVVSARRDTEAKWHEHQAKHLEAMNKRLSEMNVDKLSKKQLNVMLRAEGKKTMNEINKTWTEPESTKEYDMFDHSESSVDVLIHHGIKGMKWGVRRTPAQLGHKVMGSLLKNRVNTSKDVKSSKAGKLTKAGKLSKDMDKLSDKELRQRLNRAKMEMEVKELAVKEKRANRSWVVNALNDTAKTSAKNIATNQMTKAGNQFIDWEIENAPSQIKKVKSLIG